MQGSLEQSTGTCMPDIYCVRRNRLLTLEKFSHSQILPTLKFIRNYIEENPLICCYEEISTLKELLTDRDELKLRQKNSTINLIVNQGLYYFKTKLVVPDNYPVSHVRYAYSFYVRSTIRDPILLIHLLFAV